MLVRIQGKVTAVHIDGGMSKSGKQWSKKTYTISDDFKNPEYNRSVRVDDFGKLDPNSFNGEFIYKSNHIVGETVDIACFIETNEYGFTNVSYGKEFADIEQKPATSNVIRPDAQLADGGAPAEPAYVPAEEREDKSDLPF